MEEIRTSEAYSQGHREAKWGTPVRVAVTAAHLGSRVSWPRNTPWKLELIGALLVVSVIFKILSRPGQWKPPAEMGHLFPYKPADREVEERRTWPLARELVRPFVYTGCYLPRRPLPKALKSTPSPLVIEAPKWPGAKSTHLLHALHFKRAEATRLLVISTPNNADANTLSALGVGFICEGFEVLIWDYPGYGLSQGAPNYDSCIAGARRVAEVARELAGEKELWFYGWSLGGPHAAEMAAQDDRSKLILDRTFASTAHIVTWMPSLAQWALPYNTLERVKQMTNSKKRVIFHGGSKDALFGLEHMRAFQHYAQTLESEIEHHSWHPPLDQLIATLSSD